MDDQTNQQFPAGFDFAEKPSARVSFEGLLHVIRFIYRVDRVAFCMSFIGSLFRAPAVAIGAFAIKGVTDAVVRHDPRSMVLWGVAGVGTMLVQYVIDDLRDSRMRIWRYAMERALDGHAMDRISSLPYGILEDARMQAFLNVFQRRVNVLENVADRLTRFATVVSRLLGSVAALLVVPRAVFFLALGSIAVYAVLTYKAQNLKWALLRYDSREGRQASYCRGLLTVPHAVLHVRLFGLEKLLRGRWQSIIDGQYALRLRDVRFGRMLNLFISGTTVATYGIGLWLTGSAVLAGTATLGVLTLFLMSFNSVSDLIYEISFEIRWLQEERSAFPLLRQLDNLPQIDERGRAIPEGKIEIEFRDVTFRYPGTSEDVLHGVSFRIREGEHVGIIGLNGAGKTTILKLLLGFYTPASGRIIVNGRDLAEYDPSSWRRALSMMSQDIFRFEGPIDQQVAFGDPDLDDEARLASAARASCLDEVVGSLPQGWRTYAGRFSSMPEDRAVELSGGQAQIVGNARVLYRKARVYVFDEPTSSVDGMKEDAFFGRLPEHVNGSALIYVSHRFSTLRRAKRILVIADGRVSEDGSHDELIALNGIYESLFRQQAAHYC